MLSPKERADNFSICHPQYSPLVVHDDAIVCDFCNEDITEFPCPVWHGHALCCECRRKVKLVAG